MKIECLILLIGIKGIDNQSIALAKNLGFEFKKIKIEINPFLGTFPFFGQIFNNLGNNLKLIKKYNFKYLITTGKKLSGVSVALKKIYGKRIINIHLQKPNFYSKYFDILVTPEHDDFYRKNNVIKIIGSLVPFNEIEIKKKNPLIERKFKYFKSPNVLVLLGGKSKRFTPTNTDYSKLLLDIKYAAKKISANVIICQSRRTPENILYLAEQIFSDFTIKCCEISAIFNFASIIAFFSEIFKSLDQPCPHILTILSENLFFSHHKFVNFIKSFDDLIEFLFFTYDLLQLVNNKPKIIINIILI